MLPGAPVHPHRFHEAGHLGIRDGGRDLLEAAVVDPVPYREQARAVPVEAQVICARRLQCEDRIRHR
ncbi:MAG: hypothetical protein ACRYGP_07765 [Janthinobacterium lividum]